jgi:hypothetical protein
MGSMNLQRSGLHLLLITLIMMIPTTAEVAVSGTDVFIEPPPGYQAATTFTGFQEADGQWFLTVTQVPISLAELLPRMTDAALAEKGMEVVVRQQVQTVNGEVTLIRATQGQGGVLYEKLIILIGNEGQAAAVTGGYPVALSDSLREPMKQSLLTAQIKGERKSLNLTGLPYTYRDSEEFQPSSRVSQTLVLTPPDTLKSDTEGAVFIGLSPLNARAGSDPETLVRSELQSVYKDLVLDQPESVKLDEYEALEYTGSGTGRKAGTPAALYFLILVDHQTGNFFGAFGEMPAEQKDIWLPRFRAVGRSLRPN